MPSRAAMLFTIFALALPVAACDGGASDAELAKLDNQITNDADPALTSAIEDQILVDPALTQQSNKNVVRPPETPTQAQYPLPAGTAAGAPARSSAQPAAGARQAAAAHSRAAAPAAPHAEAHAALGREIDAERGTACGAEFDHNPQWARRLPPAFQVLPGARVTEAAGNNSGDCRVRIVTFVTRAAPQRVLDWYHTKAVRAGYSSEHQLREQDHVLAGMNGRDGGAFYLIVTPVRGGSNVALIANNGG